MAIENVPLNKSLLIVGPPDTGKASVLRSLPIFQDTLYIDLDDPLLVRELLVKSEFIKDILAEVQPREWLTINRIDRMMKYLPLLVDAIQNRNIFIAATTSTLDGFEKDTDLFSVSNCAPLSYSQIKGTLDLGQILNYGTLPKVYNLEKDVDKIRYLKNYVQDFLDNELLAKSLVRNLVPFHLFLPLAAEYSGQKLNFTSLSQDLDVDYKTVQNYFDLLISHRVGFFLRAYDKTIRKTQQQAPRFYFFDTGFHRAMGNQLDSTFVENSSEYNRLFKVFCLNEFQKINMSKNLNCKFSYLETKDGAAIDLILEKPNGTTTLIVFISAPKVLPKHVKHLKSIGKSIPSASLVCVTNATNRGGLDNVSLIPYELIDSILS